jgi:hypothetical protein
MADPSDYTQMWSGVFTPPRIGDHDRGIYLLDDEASVGRNTKIYDDCTRVLYDDAHPRTHPGGQRSPGPYGAGRASDRVGPTYDEREAAARRASARFAGEGFSGSAPPSRGDRRRYIEGSRRLGHPGPRGMVTSGREGRPAIDNAVWDNRPPHFADDTPNEYAHLYIAPEARGPALFRKNTAYPGFRQVDRFGASPGGGAGIAVGDTLEIVKVVVFIVIVILVVMCGLQQMISGAEKRIERTLECRLLTQVSALREALAAPPGRHP